MSRGLTGLVNPEGFSKIDATRMPPTPSASSAVSTLVYDFTVDILGHLDDSTGAITYDDGQGGYDLLSRIVVTVLDRGGGDRGASRGNHRDHLEAPRSRGCVTR